MEVTKKRIKIRHTSKFHIFNSYLSADFSHGLIYHGIVITNYQVSMDRQFPLEMMVGLHKCVQEGHRYVFEFGKFMHLVKRDYQGFFQVSVSPAPSHWIKP